jgi:hypothetical protein
MDSSGSGLAASAGATATPGSSDWQKHLRISRSDNHGEMASALMGNNAQRLATRGGSLLFLLFQAFFGPSCSSSLLRFWRHRLFGRSRFRCPHLDAKGNVGEKKAPAKSHNPKIVQQMEWRRFGQVEFAEPKKRLLEYLLYFTALFI